MGSVALATRGGLTVAPCLVDRHEGREAMDGSRLCEGCARNIARDAHALVELYADLIEPRSGGLAQRVSGTVEPRIPYDDAFGDLRDDIRRVLASWAALIVDEAGVSSPGVGVESLAYMIGAHWLWLAAHEAARDASDELYDLAWVRPRRLPRAGTTRRIERIATCPCGAEARAILRHETRGKRSAIECSAGHVVEAGGEWVTQLAPEAQGRITVDEASVFLYGDASWVDSVRQRITRGMLTRGDDGRLDLREVVELYANMAKG